MPSNLHQLITNWGQNAKDGVIFTKEKPGRPSLLTDTDISALVEEIEEGYYDERGHSRFFMSKTDAFIHSKKFQEVRERTNLTPDHIWRTVIEQNPGIRKIRAHLVKELLPDILGLRMVFSATMATWPLHKLNQVVYIEAAAALTIPDGDNRVWVGPNTNQAIMENVHIKRSGSCYRFKFYAAVNAKHGRIGKLKWVHPTTDYDPETQYKVGWYYRNLLLQQHFYLKNFRCTSDLENA
jgi:hypothetical protein